MSETFEEKVNNLPLEFKIETNNRSEEFHILEYEFCDKKIKSIISSYSITGPRFNYKTFIKINDEYIRQFLVFENLECAKESTIEYIKEYLIKHKNDYIIYNLKELIKKDGEDWYYCTNCEKMVNTTTYDLCINCGFAVNVWSLQEKLKELLYA